MSEQKYPWPPAPWSWKGEDYRGGWGWQILVDAQGRGIAVSQGLDGGPEPALRAFVPIEADLCLTGMEANLAPHVEPLHVMETAAPLIKRAPELFEALKPFAEFIDSQLSLHPKKEPPSFEDYTRASKVIFEIEQELINVRR